MVNASALSKLRHGRSIMSTALVASGLCRGEEGGAAVMSGAVLEAPAFVAGLDDVAVMGQAIEQGGSHFGVSNIAEYPCF